MDLGGQAEAEGVLDLVKGQQQRWKWRLEEMDASRVTRRVYYGKVAGKYSYP